VLLQALVRLSSSRSEDDLTLIVRHFMSSLVNAGEGEVAILPHLTVLDTTPGHGLISSGAELLRMRVLQLETDSFATEPVANVVLCKTSQLRSLVKQ
jgi:hypothetical protein